MRHKPKAKVKRGAAQSAAEKVRVARAAVTAAKPKKPAVASRLKAAKPVVQSAKAKAKAKAKATEKATAAAKPVRAQKAPAKTKVAAAPLVVKPVVRAVSPARLALRTRKPRTPLSGAKQAKFALGQVVKHRIYAFRGVVFDIDPVFSNTEDWWLAIPADVRPRKDQPFYHLLAENEETEYIAYVSEQNLIADTSGQPLRHPQLQELFVEDDDGRLRAVFMQPN